MFEATLHDETVAAPGRHGLSARELPVLRWVAAGASNKRIARHLGLSVHTVKRHVARLLTKLGAATRAEAAVLHRAMEPAAPPVPGRAVEPLTARELDVIGRVALGESNMRIAASLSVSVNTVKRHTANIRDKLGAHSRIEAAAIVQARQHGVPGG